MDGCLLLIHAALRSVSLAPESLRGCQRRKERISDYERTHQGCRYQAFQTFKRDPADQRWGKPKTWCASYSRRRNTCPADWQSANLRSLPQFHLQWRAGHHLPPGLYKFLGLAVAERSGAPG